MLWVIERENFCGHAKAFICEDGMCPYTGKTKEDFIAEGYSILSDDEFLLLVRQWEDTLCGDWKEIDEDTYEEMLNILPPLQWCNGGFYISERYTGNISNFYQKLDGKYYTSLQRIGTPREKLLGELRGFIRASATIKE